MASFDLTKAFEAGLFDGPRGHIGKLYRQLAAVRAVHADIGEAQTNLRLLEGLPAPQGGRLDDLSYHRAEAYVTTAIMCYCRAFHSRSSVRFNVGLPDHDSRQREAHQRITKLRDQVIAHYGYGRDQPGGFWVRDHVVLHLDEAGVVTVSYPSVRVATKAQIIADMSELVELADTYLEGKGSDRQGAFMTALVDRLESDFALRDALEDYRYSDEKFFGQVKGSHGITALPAGSPYPGV